MKRAKAYLYLSVAMIIVGSSVIVGKVVTDTFPVFLASGLRFGVASFILVPLLFLKENKFPKLDFKEKIILFMQAFTGVFCFSIFLLVGLRYTTASASGIITGTTPAVIGLISIVFLKEKISWNKVMGILLTVVGIISINVISNVSETRLGDSFFVGNMLIFGAVIGEALFTILGKVLSEKLSPLAISTGVTVIGFILFLPLAIFQGLTFDFSLVPITGWFSIAYYAVVVTVIGFFLWYKGVSRVSGSTAAVFTGVLPISSILMANVILGETFLLSYLVGILSVLLGIGLITLVKDTSTPVTANYK